MSDRELDIKYSDKQRCRICGWPAARLGYEHIERHGAETYHKWVPQYVMPKTRFTDPHATVVSDADDTELLPGVKTKKKREHYVRVYTHLCTRGICKPAWEGYETRLRQPEYECSVLGEWEMEPWPADVDLPDWCYFDPASLLRPNVKALADEVLEAIGPEPEPELPLEMPTDYSDNGHEPDTTVIVAPFVEDDDELPPF